MSTAVAPRSLADTFRNDRSKVLSIYLTAGYPGPDDLGPLLETLDAAGVDLVEVGMPYSDPLADGPVIQAASARALAGGMTMDRLFAQVAAVRPRIRMPLVWMGYWNAILRYGVERFARSASNAGFSAVIVPDLPPERYADTAAAAFSAEGLQPVFLVTPRTPPERIRFIDERAEGFVYLVSAAALTGRAGGVSPEAEAYLARVRAMGLRNPTLVGFGIHDRESFAAASRHADGAIVGSAFLRALDGAADPRAAARAFVAGLR